jgi:hypothetical protein
MAYIGNQQQNQSYSPGVDYFNGTGSTTAFTLSRPVASVYQIQVVVENVPQNPSSAYTVSGNTLTFTSAPPSGTNNIYVNYTSPNTQVVQPGQGTVGLSQISATGTPSSSTYLRGDNTWATLITFDSGTTMLFAQTSAPTGWTKSTSHDNKALRVVSGSASSGGSVAFTTAFASQTPSGSVSVSGTVGATTLTTSQVPNATGTLVQQGNRAGLQSGTGVFSGVGSTAYAQVGAGSVPASFNFSLGFGGGSHGHSFSGSGSFSGTAINLAVQYVDVIIATKD